MRQVTSLHRTLVVLAVGLLALAAPLVAYADGGPAPAASEQSTRREGGPHQRAFVVMRRRRSRAVAGLSGRRRCFPCVRRARSLARARAAPRPRSRQRSTSARSPSAFAVGSSRPCRQERTASRPSSRASANSHAAQRSSPRRASREPLASDHRSQKCFGHFDPLGGLVEPTLAVQSFGEITCSTRETAVGTLFAEVRAQPRSTASAAPVVGEELDVPARPLKCRRGTAPSSASVVSRLVRGGREPSNSPA